MLAGGILQKLIPDSDRRPSDMAEIWSTDGIMWPSLAPYREAAEQALNDLETVRDHGPLDDKAVPLVVVLKNEEKLIGSFLGHYRALGVTRFMVVDNGSVDATPEILRRQDDVDLWRTDASFKAANQGCLWRDGLLFARARDRWVLSVDADEFLVFAGMEKPRAIKRLAARLEQLGDSRLLAPMLDVYPDRPIAEVEIDPNTHPLKTLDWFDGGPEFFEIRRLGIWIGGGPRRRLFFADEAEMLPGLSKYPLVRYDSETAFVGIHHPSPYERNTVRTFGRLMHVKLHGGLAARAKEAIDSGQYWQQSAEYRRYAEVLSASPSLTAHGRNSLRYRGPKSLIEAGLMEDPRSVWRIAPKWFSQRALARRAQPDAERPKGTPPKSTTP